MKSITWVLCCFLATLSMQAQENNSPEITIEMEQIQQLMLRHVVAFKFKEGTSQQDINKVVKAFEALPKKITEIKDFEWGTNNSPEGFNKGMTHCFILSFQSEADRDAYLPHPEHKAFGEIAGPHIEDVFVIDYWQSN